MDTSNRVGTFPPLPQKPTPVRAAELSVDKNAPNAQFRPVDQIHNANAYQAKTRYTKFNNQPAVNGDEFKSLTSTLNNIEKRAKTSTESSALLKKYALENYQSTKNSGPEKGSLNLDITI